MMKTTQENTERIRTVTYTATRTKGSLKTLLADVGIVIGPLLILSLFASIEPFRLIGILVVTAILAMFISFAGAFQEQTAHFLNLVEAPERSLRFNEILRATFFIPGESRRVIESYKSDGDGDRYLFPILTTGLVTHLRRRNRLGSHFEVTHEVYVTSRQIQMIQTVKIL